MRQRLKINCASLMQMLRLPLVSIIAQNPSDGHHSHVLVNFCVNELKEERFLKVVSWCEGEAVRNQGADDSVGSMISRRCKL